MRIPKSIAVAFFLILVPKGMCAQEGRIDIGKNLTYKQPVTPVVLDNYLFSTFYGAGKKSYNLKGFEIGSAPMPILSVKVNPAGASYAVLSGNGKKSRVEIFDSYVAGKRLHEFKDATVMPTAIAYTADSRHLFIAAGNGLVSMYNTKTLQSVRQFPLPFAPIMMQASSNGYHLVAANSSSVVVADIESGHVRTNIGVQGTVRDVAFSEDAAMLGVLVGDGTLTVYDTRSFTVVKTFGALGEAASMSFHPDGKYIAVVTADNTVTFVNLTDDADRASMTDSDGQIGYVRFLKDSKRQVYLSYNSKNAVKYKLLKGFSPNYTKMLRDELAARMEEWSKIGEGESMDDYKMRVNEESRVRQARLFEQEIATRMADNLVMTSNVSLGKYNPNNGMLTLDFDNMPAVYLTVPEEDVRDFMVPANLEFRDAVYGLTKNDRFELIYANIYNKVTGKVYELNNLDRQSLDFLSSEDSFVPIELVRQSGMEEMRLNTIRRNVVELARQNNLISDHTNIQVNTSVVSDVSAAGDKITNYKIGFNYTVESDYSVREDFPAGKYRTEQSHAAESMLEIVKQAFEEDFAQYVRPGKKVTVRITGSADAIPVHGTIPYDGCYGEFEEEPYYLDQDLSTLTVTKTSGIRSNEQLAFMRAVAVQNYVRRHVPALDAMDTEYVYRIELSEKSGGEYRRINVEFTFVDAF